MSIRDHIDIGAVIASNAFDAIIIAAQALACTSCRITLADERKQNGGWETRRGPGTGRAASS